MNMPRGLKFENYGIFIALFLMILFGALRYENFLSSFNILTFLRYNSMFALVSLGMAFVIFTGGIDLSVGAVAALGSVTSALVSQYGIGPGLIAGVGAGALVGLINGLIVSKTNIAPFIATLATMLASSGTALLLSGNQSVSVSYDSNFTSFGQDDFLGFPIPAWVAILVYVIGYITLQSTSFGRSTLAVGGNEDASRLMGLQADRVKLIVYLMSGSLAGLAGVILASQFGAGQPIEGIGWELFSIASVVVGGSLLTGGKGAIGSTYVGCILLGLIFNMLNFENGLGWISLSAHWQSVIRGLILLVVVILQVKLMNQNNRS